MPTTHAMGGERVAGVGALGREVGTSGREVEPQDLDLHLLAGLHERGRVPHGGPVELAIVDQADRAGQELDDGAEGLDGLHHPPDYVADGVGLGDPLPRGGRALGAAHEVDDPVKHALAVVGRAGEEE